MAAHPPCAAAGWWGVGEGVSANAVEKYLRHQMPAVNAPRPNLPKSGAGPNILPPVGTRYETIQTPQTERIGQIGQIGRVGRDCRFALLVEEFHSRAAWHRSGILNRLLRGPPVFLPRLGPISASYPAKPGGSHHSFGEYTPARTWTIMVTESQSDWLWPVPPGMGVVGCTVIGTCHKTRVCKVTAQRTGTSGFPA